MPLNGGWRATNRERKRFAAEIITPRDATPVLMGDRRDFLFFERAGTPREYTWWIKCHGCDPYQMAI